MDEIQDKETARGRGMEGLTSCIHSSRVLHEREVGGRKEMGRKEGWRRGGMEEIGGGRKEGRRRGEGDTGRKDPSVAYG